MKNKESIDECASIVSDLVFEDLEETIINVAFSEGLIDEPGDITEEEYEVLYTVEDMVYVNLSQLTPLEKNVVTVALESLMEQLTDVIDDLNQPERIDNWFRIEAIKKTRQKLGL